MAEPPQVSVVVALLDQQATIEALVARARDVLEASHRTFEIILVDDGSRDRTVEIVRRLEAADERVRVFEFTRNFGQAAALACGIFAARGAVVVQMDGDLQNPPEEIPRLVEAARQGYDVVGTVRQQRQDTWFRRKASRTLNHLIQRVTGKAMGDYGCMLRAYRRHIVEAMLNCHERSTFIPILANTFARHTIELPVIHAERAFGDSKYSFMRLINLMYDLVTCLTTTPLRLLSVVGSLIALSGFAFSLVLIVLRLFFGAAWAGHGFFVLFAVLFMFIGAQFVGMGLLGEYIGRIYNDVRARPRYFVQRIVQAPEEPSVQDTQS